MDTIAASGPKSTNNRKLRRAIQEDGTAEPRAVIGKLTPIWKNGPKLKKRENL